MDAFLLSNDYGSIEKCISRLQIIVPPLIAMLDNGINIPRNVYDEISDNISIFSDVNRDVLFDFSIIEDPELRAKLNRILQLMLI